MRPVRRFEVRPTIPEALATLPELATNLHWAWDREAMRLFERIWPGWTADDAHPAHMVRTTSSERLAALAEDQAVVRDLAAAKGRLDAAITGPTWFATKHADKKTTSPLGTVAYFSPEFGLTEALPQYSGGLGVLSGDHLKASADLGVPLVGIGLLYTEGYFHQELDADGWQQEHRLNMDPQSLGLTDTGVRVAVDLAGDPVTIRVWRADVGRVPLYLLDTDVEGNSADGVAVTDRLYGGDSHHRLRQEIVLGIGGVRALRALDIDPQVFHTNEGHAGFLSLERIREHVAAGMAFDAAVEAVRAGGVFTTHTPVPAGIDRFERALIEKYFSGFADECGVTIDELFAIGTSPDEDGDDPEVQHGGDVVAPRRPPQRRRRAARQGQSVDVQLAVARPAGERGADRSDHQRRPWPQLDVEPGRCPAHPDDRRRLVIGRLRSAGRSPATSIRQRCGTPSSPAGGGWSASCAGCSAAACSTRTR